MEQVKSILPTEVVPALTKSPKSLIIFGQSKVGKTTLLSKLKNCLIIDTEQGSDFVEALKVKVNSWDELLKIYVTLKTPGAPKYDYIAIDTIDKVYEWAEQLVIVEYNQSSGERPIKSIGDIAYGAGYNLVRSKLMSAVNAFKSLGVRIIIVGHRKKTIIGSETVEFSSNSIDLSGKLKNILMADMDAIGYVYRKDGELMISFKTSDEIEVGSRCEHLRGKEIPFQWENIYID